MFDAKSLLEDLVRGASPQASGQQPSGGGGGLSDILGQILQGTGGQSSAGTGASQGGGLQDILNQLQRSLQSNAQPSTGQAGGTPSQNGGLGDVLNQIKNQIGQAGGALQGGGVMDVLGQILSQATQGVKEGAGRIDSATGATDAITDVLAKATGQSPSEVLSKLQQILRDNPMAAGTALGGLGGLVLGTQTGRSIAGSAARLGALALIGGLAYKAFQNYQTGRPLITGATAPEAAPEGSGFEPGAMTNDAAMLYINAMVAAAAADGRIDAGEQNRVVGSLKQAGIDAEAEQFLANAFNNPPSITDIANAVNSPEEAIQVYTAARIAIDPDTTQESAFLSQLANALGIDAKLAAHIDSTARSAAA
ncbi:MAG: tellurite resistance TerB family protein [Hyphomicrobium sp.]